MSSNIIKLHGKHPWPEDEKHHRGPDFDWNDEQFIVQRETEAVAVYRNGAGDITIRQRAGIGDRDDTYIVIGFNNVPDLIAALKRESGT